jgi:hypothetical protein
MKKKSRKKPPRINWKARCEDIEDAYDRRVGELEQRLRGLMSVEIPKARAQHAELDLAKLFGVLVTVFGPIEEPITAVKVAAAIHKRLADYERMMS